MSISGIGGQSSYDSWKTENGLTPMPDDFFDAELRIEVALDKATAEFNTQMSNDLHVRSHVSSCETDDGMLVEVELHIPVVGDGGEVDDLASVLSMLSDRLKGVRK